MAFRSLDGVELAGKRALVRVDFNVPMAGGAISDDTRLRAALPTIARLRAGGAKVILLAHFDRPKGKRVPEMSLAPVAGPLAALVGAPVAFVDDCVGPAAAAAVAAMNNGDVLLLENLRFHAGEERNDAAFAAALAANGDLYVNDAFSAAHRAHASTEAIAGILPAYAGEAMRRELDALDAALGSPQRPVLGIVGGSKVSTKLDLLNNLVAKLDYLAIGGGMANTFLFAQGHDIAASFALAVAMKMEAGVVSRICDLDGLEPADRILDAGPKTVARLTAAMDKARTLIWNGPLGVFEIPPFDAATTAAARHAGALAKAGRLIAVAGGGDTVSALHHAGASGDFTFISTAGGAFLEWMEGKELPGVAALQV